MLSPEEAPVFFSLCDALDTFANRRLQVAPGFEDLETMREANMQLRYDIRTALWARRELLDEFIHTNPFNLPAAAVDDARGFQRAATGRFYCERVLKKHAIVISLSEPPVVYAVEGLTEPVESVLTRSAYEAAGVVFNATLLPWRGRIVWDGLVSVLPLHVGPGIRRMYKDTYNRAKAAGAIRTSLGEAHAAAAKPRKAPRDWRPAVEGIVESTEALGKPETPQQAAVFALLKASAKLAQVTLGDDREAERDALGKVLRAWRRVVG